MTLPKPNPTPRRRWLTWLRVAFSLGLLGYLLYTVNLRECVDVLLHADMSWLAITLALFAFGRFLNGMRWYLLLKGVEPGVGYGQVMRIFFMSSFVGQFMPGIVGMEAIRVVALGKSIQNTAQAFASVLVDRILGFFSLVTVVLVALWLDPIPNLHFPLTVQYAALVGLVCLIAGSVAIITPPLRRLLDQLMPGPVRKRVSPKLHKIYGCLDAYRGIPLRVLFVLGLSMLAQLQTVTESFTMAKALGIHVDFEYFVVFIPVIFFLLMLPVTISGLGVREGAYIYAFHTLAHQMTWEQAFTLSLMMMFVVRLTSLPGVYFVAVSRKKLTTTVHDAEVLAENPPTPPEEPLAFVQPIPAKP